MHNKPKAIEIIQIFMEALIRGETVYYHFIMLEQGQLLFLPCDTHMIDTDIPMFYDIC